MSKDGTKSPLTPQRSDKSPTVSPPSEVQAFLARAATLSPSNVGERGRLMFALDATMSRQPTWDTACRLTADMFREAGSVGSLDVQLVYFRSISECRASRWVSDANQLADLMTRIECRGGHTQIRKVLAHAKAETGRKPVQALVFVGDAMEEPIDDLAAAAGELGLLGVPAFVFQEGRDGVAEPAFREVARLTRGAYCRFDTGAAQELAQLLRAVAVYAAGGRKALADLSPGRNAQARLLLDQMR